MVFHLEDIRDHPQLVREWEFDKDKGLFYPRFGGMKMYAVCNEQGRAIFDRPIRQQKNSGVVIVPYSKSKDSIQVGLIKQYRWEQGKDIWLFPMGLKEEGESYEDACLREMGEESGLKSKNLPEYLGEGVPNVSWDLTIDKFYAVNVEEIVNSEEEFGEESERVRAVRGYNFSQLQDMQRDGQLYDGLFKAGLTEFILKHPNLFIDNFINSDFLIFL